MQLPCWRAPSLTLPHSHTLVHLSQLLQYARDLKQDNFAAKFHSVWLDSAHAAFDACIQFIENSDPRENLEEFERRWLALQMRQLLLQRREKVSAQPQQQAVTRGPIHMFC